MLATAVLAGPLAALLSYLLMQRLRRAAARLQPAAAPRRP